MNPCSRFHEFFEVDGVYSMRNMTVFITICGATAVVLYQAAMGVLSEGVFTAYVLAGGGVYGYGKNQDTREKLERFKNASVVNKAPRKP